MSETGEETTQTQPPTEAEVVFPSADTAYTEMVIKPDMNFDEKCSIARISVDRELRTGNITEKDMRQLSDEIELAEDQFKIGLTERADRTVRRIIRDMGLSKSKDGWQQETLRTTFSRKQTKSIQETGEKKKGLLSGFFGGE